DLDARYVLAMGAGGAILRTLATWATSGLAQHMAATVKRDLRSKLWGRIAAGDAEGAERASDDDAAKPTAPAAVSAAREGQGPAAAVASDGLDDIDDSYPASIPATIQAVVVPLIVGLRNLGAAWFSALIVVVTIPLGPLFMVLIGKHTQE